LFLDAAVAAGRLGMRSGFLVRNVDQFKPVRRREWVAPLGAPAGRPFPQSEIALFIRRPPPDGLDATKVRPTLVIPNENGKAEGSQQAVDECRPSLFSRVIARNIGQELLDD